MALNEPAQQADEQSRSLQPQTLSTEAKQLSDLLHLLRKSQQHELDSWIRAHPTQVEDMQVWLLADALFARLHMVPAIAPDSIKLLDALAHTQPIPSMRPYRSLLDASDFHASLFRMMQSPIAVSGTPNHRASGLLDSLLNYGLAYFFRVQDLPRLRIETAHHNEIFDRMSFISGESGPVDRPEMLPLLLYLQTWRRDPEELTRLQLQAEQHGMPAFYALLLLDQARELSSQVEAAGLLKRAQGLAKSIQSPMIQFQALLQLTSAEPKAAAKHAAEAEALLRGLPEGQMKQAGTKRWADYLLRHSRLEEARQLYRQLADAGEPWMLDWLLSSFEKTRDAEMLPLIERLIRHGDEQIGQKAISVWLSLIPEYELSHALSRIEPLLPDARQGYLLANLPQFADDKSKSYERIREALSSDSIPLQVGALSFLKKQPVYNPVQAEVPFVQEATALLASPHTEIQLAALGYLSSRKRFDPASLPLLQRGDIEVRRQVLWLLQPVARDIPPESIRPLLQAEDRELRLNALALLILSGKHTRIEDFVTLWSEERFYNAEGFERALAESLKSGAISWTSWRQALEQSLLASDQEGGSVPASKLLWSLAVLNPLPAPALSQLDELLVHPNPTIRYDAIQRLRTGPRTPARSRRIAELAERESNPDMRANALHYLADFPEKAWNDLFRKALSDPSDEVRQAAGRFFSRSSPVELQARLDQAQDLSDEEVLGLIESLTSAQISPQELKPRIRSLFDERSPAFREALVSRLLTTVNPFLDPDMINSLVTPDSLDTELLRFLVRKPVWLKPDTLKRLLESANPEASSAALILAGAKGDVTVFDVLVPMFSDQRIVPADLLEALDYHIYPPVSGPVTIRMLALRVLNELDEARTRPLLPAALRDPDPNLRRYALTLLNEAEATLPPDQLQPLLQDADTAVRFEALQISARQMTQPNLPMVNEHRLAPELWVPFLRDPDPSLRARASYILKSHPLLEARHLTSLLQDADPEIRRHAQDLLAVLDKNSQPVGLNQILDELRGRPHSVAHWKRKGLPAGLSWDQIYAGVLGMIQSVSPQEPYAADSLARVLTEIRGSAAIPDVLRLLDSHDISVYALQPVSTPEYIPHYVRLLEQAKSPRHLKLAIALLDHHKHANYLSMVIPYLTHPDPELQGSAIRFVGNHGSDTDRALLLPLLNASPMPYGIFDALALRPIPQAFGQIVAQLEHPDHVIRSHAINLAGAWKLRAALPVLIRQLEPGAEKEQSLSYNIMSALGRIGDPAAIPVLRKALARRPQSLAAIESLYVLGDADTARSALLNYLDQADSDDRISALELIRDVQDKKLIPYLIKQLPSREAGTSYRAESSYEVGELAANLLTDLAGPEHVPELILQLPALHSERREEVDYIIESISKRHPVWPSSVLSELTKLSSHADPVINQTAKKWLSKPGR